MSLRPAIPAVLVLATLLSGCGSPVEPAPAQTAWVALTMGDGHGCVLDPEGRAACFGANNAGQLGTGNDAQPADPAWVDTPLRFSDIDAGAFHTCAVDADGVVWCWGANESGQLGTGDRAGARTPARVDLPPGGWTSVSAGLGHSCAVREDGTGACWGDNRWGQLGLGLSTDGPVAPAVLEGDWVEIDAGYEHSCGVWTDRGAACWGANPWGQLGTGVASGATAPSRVAGRLAFRTVAVGEDYSCGVTGAGEGWCWGGAVEDFPIAGAGPSVGTPVRADLGGGRELVVGPTVLCSLAATSAGCRRSSGEELTGGVPVDAILVEASRARVCWLVQGGSLGCAALR